MKDEDHPELPATIEGMNEYIRKLRHVRVVRRDLASCHGECCG